MSYRDVVSNGPKVTKERILLRQTEHTVITTDNASQPFLKIFTWVMLFVLTAKPIGPSVPAYPSCAGAWSYSTYTQFARLRTSVSTSS